jgi:predicted SpoU family rRNA methylase
MEDTRCVQRIDIFFEGMSSDVIIEKENISIDYFNFYTTGTPNEGITHVHYYGLIRYKNVYPNIDFEFEITNEGKAEYYWIIKPGGNIEDIQQKYIGTSETRLENGKIIMQMNDGILEENIPASYYADNKNELLNVSFQLFQSAIQITNQSTNSSICKYKTGNYDQSRTIIIDPTPNLEWSTYYGGNMIEYAYYGIMSNSNNEIIATGTTSSNDYIATSGAYQTSLAGKEDVFIVCFNSNGTRKYATYFGGSGSDFSFDSDLDSEDNIVITGFTESSKNIASIGAYSTVYKGDRDAFIAQFNNAGMRIWSTYYGDKNYDIANSIITDSENNIIISGWTESTKNIASPGSFQEITGGNRDGFIVKLDSDGQRLWATYSGGSSIDYLYGICTDSKNNIIVCGETYSTNNIAISGAYQSILGGSADADIIKFNKDGSLIWATYFGGSAYDHGSGITTDSLDNIVMIGTTYSDSNIVTANGYQIILGGGGFTTECDAFIVKFDSSGVEQWASYYGGIYEDKGNGITSDSKNNIIITGYTYSTTLIASNNSYQEVFGGGGFTTGYDGFIAKFEDNGNRIWGTYYGGSNYDYACGVTSNDKDEIIITGTSFSSDYITSSLSYDSILNGISDIFIARFSDSIPFPIFTFVNENQNFNEIKIYPSPINEHLTVYLPAMQNNSTQLTLYNFMGEVMFSRSFMNERINIHTFNFPNGIYFLKIENGNNNIMKEIIIQH